MKWTPGKIRDLRKRMGLKLEPFAELVGVTDGAIWLWERGERTPSGLAERALDRVEEDLNAGRIVPEPQPV